MFNLNHPESAPEIKLCAVSASLPRGAGADVPWSGAVNIPDWKLFPSSFQSDVCCTWLRSDNCRRKSCRKYIWIVFK